MFDMSTGSEADQIIHFQYTERRMRVSENREGF